MNSEILVISRQVMVGISVIRHFINSLRYVDDTALIVKIKPGTINYICIYNIASKQKPYLSIRKKQHKHK